MNKYLSLLWDFLRGKKRRKVVITATFTEPKEPFKIETIPVFDENHKLVSVTIKSSCAPCAIDKPYLGDADGVYRSPAGDEEKQND